MRAFSILLAGLALCTGLSHAAEIQLGSLALDWPQGYTVKSTQPPFELAGPGGAKAMVTVLRPGSKALSAEEIDEVGERMLTAQAQKAGRVVLPLGKEMLPDGTQLRYIGSEVSGLLRSGYLLQYMLVAPQGQIALVTFEGRGETLSQHESLRGLFRSVRWEAGEGSAAERTAFTEKVALLLRTQIRDQEVVVADPLTLKVGELQANLDRVYTFCRRNAAGCDAVLARYVQVVGEVHGKAAAPVAREALRLVVRSADFGAGVPADKLLRRPFAANLVALPIVDSERSARGLTEADCATLELTPDEAVELARANLRAALKPLASVADPVERGRIGTLQGDFYESGRVLLPEGWPELARAQGGVLVVALPAKDILLYSADDSPSGLDALRSAARDLSRRSASPLSDVLLKWTSSGWQAVAR